MAYNQKRKANTIKYIKEKQREIKLRYRTADYEDIIKQIRRTGKPTATFIKEAIAEKLERLAQEDLPVVDFVPADITVEEDDQLKFTY